MVLTIDSDLAPFLPLCRGDGIIPGSIDWADVGKPKTLLDLMSLVKKYNPLSFQAARLLMTLCKSHERIASLSVYYILECLQLSKNDQVVASNAPEAKMIASQVCEYLYHAIRSYPENLYPRFSKLVANEGKNVLSTDNAHYRGPLLWAAWGAELRFRAAQNNPQSIPASRNWTSDAWVDLAKTAFKFIGNCLSTPRLAGGENIREAIVQKNSLQSEGFPVPIVKEDINILKGRIEQLKENVPRHPTLLYLLNKSEKEMQFIINQFESSCKDWICDDINYAERFSKAWYISHWIEEAPNDLPITPINIEPFESIQDLKLKLPQLKTIVKNKYDRELIIELERIIEGIETIRSIDFSPLKTRISRFEKEPIDNIEKILKVLSKGEIV
jgi:hypothetical protein